MAAPQWIDVSGLPFNTLLLLEDPHLRWFPRDWPDNELGIALKYNPSVHDYFRTRLGKGGEWLEELAFRAETNDEETVRSCEIAVMKAICDWIVYVYCPEEYDRQPFLKWDNTELLELADFRGKVVADIGSGTGRLLEPVIPLAKTVFAIEPIGSLREYMKHKFSRFSGNFFTVDGLITEIPLPSNTCDIVLSGHVFGDYPVEEAIEMERVVSSGGMVILCPGNNDVDNDAHTVLMERGYLWSVFVEPGDGAKRKYWKRM